MNSLSIEMNMPRQSLWTVGACVIMFMRSADRVVGIKKPFGLPGRASAASISMLISLAPLRENVYFCDDEVFRSDIVSAVVPVFRGQAG